VATIEKSHQWDRSLASISHTRLMCPPHPPNRAPTSIVAGVEKMRRLYIHNTFLLFLLALSFSLPGRVQADIRVNGCQCTDYVYSQRPDIPEGMGHARDWLYSARVNRLAYDQIPQVGDVAVILNGDFGFSAEFGHVAIVIEVNGDRDRFSIEGWDGLKNDCVLQIFQDLPVTSNTFFIHRDLSTQPSNSPSFEWPHRIEDLINLLSTNFF
jgi:hypothetical protein